MVKTDQGNHHASPFKGEPEHLHSAQRLRGFVLQQTTGTPASPEMLITAMPAGSIAVATMTGAATFAPGADRPPAVQPNRDGVTVTNTHLESVL